MYACPHCQTILEMSESTDRHIKCPWCGKELFLPEKIWLPLRKLKLPDICAHCSQPAEIRIEIRGTSQRRKKATWIAILVMFLMLCFFNYLFGRNDLVFNAMTEFMMVLFSAFFFGMAYSFGLSRALWLRRFLRRKFGAAGEAMGSALAVMAWFLFAAMPIMLTVRELEMLPKHLDRDALGLPLFASNVFLFGIFSNLVRLRIFLDVPACKECGAQVRDILAIVDYSPVRGEICLEISNQSLADHVKGLAAQ